MSLTNIVSALMNGAKVVLIDRAAASGGLELGSGAVAWPNVNFTPPNEAAYAMVNILPNTPMVKTMGLGGEDEHTGVLQISLHYPLQKGQGALISAADKLYAFFAAGASLIYEDTEVRILQCGMSPPGKDDSRFVTHVSVYWRARTTRPTTITEIT